MTRRHTSINKEASILDLIPTLILSIGLIMAGISNMHQNSQLHELADRIKTIEHLDHKSE
jgi:hypothetical protein